MRKLLFIPLFLIMLFVGGQLYAQVPVLSVNSHDSSNLDDNDEIYHPGQQIVIVTKPSTSGQYAGKLEIKSAATGYKLQVPAMQKGADNTFEYVWDTTGMKEGDDYVVSATLESPDGKLVASNSLLIIKMDNTAPRILNVKSYDRVDITDNDGIYHAGQTVIIDVLASDKETGLDATIQIKSDSVLYDPGVQRLTDQRDGSYRYTWTTTGLNPAKDYRATIIFRDKASLEARDSSLVMEIDNTPPQNGRIIINNDDMYALSPQVNLSISADGAARMYVFGDVVDDIATFEWLPYAEALKVRLTSKDGVKRVYVRFSDRAGNESASADDTIILDEVPPVITSVYSYDVSERQDDDGIYHAGQTLVITVETDGSDLVKYDGIVQITSTTAKYDSGSQILKGVGRGAYTYTWNTSGLLESSDYSVFVRLKDPSNREVIDRQLRITIDNMPPSQGELSINDNQKETDSRSVTLSINATGNPREMLIDGNVIDDTNTFEWIPYSSKAVVNLTETDGTKNINIKFRDAARNVSAVTSASIILNRKSPTSVSMSIQGDAKYTTTQDVTLALHAVNADQMFIDGDVVDDKNTFEFIAYTTSVPIKLLPGDGEKRVGIVFKNQAGIRSDKIQKSIILDTTDPVILSVSSWDSGDPNDNDGIYRPGQSVVIGVITKAEDVGLSAKIRIQSVSTAYDSSRQTMDGSREDFRYVWNTSGLQSSADYVVLVQLTDGAGRRTENSDLKLVIDNSSPDPGQVVINDGEKTTDSTSIRLQLSAVNVTSMFIGGDIVSDSNTFRWIPYQTAMVVNLSGSDGQKTLSVKFRNASGSESSPAYTSISLDRKSPYNLGLVIASTMEGAKSGKSDKLTPSHEVFASLSAKNASEMYISGDVVESVNTFRWIAYAPQMALTLTKGDGNKTVFVKFRNQRLVESQPVKGEIILDTSPPRIVSITSQNVTDPNDNDGWYRPGDSARVYVETVEANELAAAIRIKSISTGYDSGELKIDSQVRTSADRWRLEYIWNTTDLNAGNDYLVEITLKDAAGWPAAGDPMLIHLDGSPPANAKAILNKGARHTASRAVTLDVSADDAVEMFLSGSLKADSNTFRWVPVKTPVAIMLISGDGAKSIEVKFRDAARNETKPVTAKIILSESPPVIEKVALWDASDLSDSDNQYHSGEPVELAIKAQSRADAPMIETGLLGSFSVSSSDGKYKSGVLNAREEDGGWYTYIWDTTRLPEGNYVVTWHLSDGAGHEVSNFFSVLIDNTPPKDPRIAINNGADRTKSRTVNLSLKAIGASWIFIDGDVLRESGITFEWIPFSADNPALSVRLTDGDGTKRIQAKFKDNADNAAELCFSQIMLDTTGPTMLSVKINGDAEYTTSTEASLTVSTKEAAAVYIDGDVADGANARKWIPYTESGYSLTLNDGDGKKTISVESQDAPGNLSSKVSDTITLDGTPPKVRSVKSVNSADPADDDGRYLEGTQVNITADSGEAKLSSTIQIRSLASGYVSSIQNMKDKGDGTYTYLWDTRLLPSAGDYTARVEFKDPAGNLSVDESLVMAIFDKPVEQKITINGGEKITKSISVQAEFSADNASEMLISGDLINDDNTFEWVKFAEKKQLDLTSDDGVKNVKAEFRDNLSRRIGTSEASIRLDQTPPTITSVKSYKSPSAEGRESKIYRAGNLVEIIAQADKREKGLKGTVQIKSFSTGYDSGTQKVIERATGEYSYSWDTAGLKEGKDYLVEVSLMDEAGWSVNDYSLNVGIDNTAPQGGSFTINGGDQSTQKRTVKLTITKADNSAEMFVEGDVVRDSNTFQWVPVKDEMVVNMTVTDAEKKISIKFRDEVGNETASARKSIVLNELPPVIASINSRDENDSADSDEIYHAGQAVKITITVNDEPGLEAWIRVSSQKAGYDSGLLVTSRENATSFTAVWKTATAPESSDYTVSAVLQDSYGQKATNDSLIITIDNTPPIASELSIEGGKSITDVQNVTLKLTSKDAAEMSIDGDVVESSITFRWIPFADTRKITLSEGNGEKKVTIRLKDSAGNISEPVSAAITLNKSIPVAASISISGGAKFTESYQVTLSLSAENAREMYISGDVIQSGSTFKWIPYEKELGVRLTKGDGDKTVYAKFRNSAGNDSNEVKVQILLDVTPPEIKSVESYDFSDKNDNDFDYHSGQKIVIRATASNNETGLKGWVQIKSEDAKYDSGRQDMTGSVGGQYNFLWNTEGMAEGSYSCGITLEDLANHSASSTMELTINDQGPGSPLITIDSKDSFVYSRTIEAVLSAENDPIEVFISGDVVDDNKTFEWIAYTPDSGNMKVTLNLRGADGKKKVTAKFRNKARSESSVAEASVTLEFKRPELIGSCRIIQSETEPFQAYLSLQFDEPIGRIDLKSFFLTLKDKTNPQNVLYLDGAGAMPVLSNDLVMLEISSEQLDEMKQWQPVTVISSYIQAEISENGVFDLADNGNISNEKKPADVYIAIPSLSMQISVEPSSFSPDDNGVKDKITILYSLALTSDVTIRIIDSQMEVVKEWQVENQAGGVVYPVDWNGKKPDGTAYPDGLYTAIVMSKALEAKGFSYGLKRSFTIDNSAPRIVDFRPWEGAEVPALFRASVSVADMPEASGIESVYMTIDNDIENKIPLAKSRTKGEYVIPATSQLLLTPGKHSVSFYAVDMAGNEVEKSVSYVVVLQVKTLLDLMNFPNPFSPGKTTTIRYSLPEKARNGELAIYDAGGDMVFYKELAIVDLESGEHAIQWNGRDMFNNLMSKGVYVCRLRISAASGEKSKVHKIALK